MQEFQVGDVRIVRVTELEFPLGQEILAIGSEPAALAEACSWAKPHFLTPTGAIVFALSATCLESDGKRIVIDPCCSFDLRRGNADIGERAEALLDELLPAAGFPPKDVDLVLNTHLDGVGWNVRPAPERWIPAFPNARHVWTQTELDRASAGATEAERQDHASLEPLANAGVVDGVVPTYEATSHVSFRPAPGHTPGNVDIWIESGDASAVVVGDHVLNPIQCADPDWTGLDAIPDRSPAIRRTLLDECARRNTLMIGPHFGAPGAGRVRVAGSAWRLDAEPIAG